MNFDLDLLRTFVAFAERKNLTAAAQARHLSQPAVHVQIKRLSETFGAVLYRRVGRHLELTAEGLRVLTFARETIERADMFARELNDEPSHSAVRLCAGEGAYLFLLGDALRRATRNGVRLHLRVADAAETVRAVAQGEAHVGVVVSPGPFDALDDVAIADVGVAVAMPASHALARKRTVDPRDLSGARLIVPPEGRALREALDVVMRAAGVAIEPVVEAGGWPLMLRFVELGIGVAVINDFCTLPRGVVARPLRGLPRQTYRVIRRRGAVHPPDAAALHAALCEVRGREARRHGAAARSR